MTPHDETFLAGTAELRDMLAADDEDEREPDELHGDRPRLAVDQRSLPVRISRLKLMSKSPAHYREACRYGDGETDTLARKLGTLADAVAFDKPIKVWTQRTEKGDKIAPRNARNAKYKQFLAEAAAERAVIASPKELAEATSMVAALRDSHIARPLLFGSQVEHDVEIEWTFLGRRCVSHVDAMCPTTLTDLKTGQTAEPERFMRSAVWYDYPAQVAFYIDACKAAGLGEREPYIVAVESSAPYPVTVLRLSNKTLEQGRKRYRVWFERLLACEAANEWPAYSQSVVYFDIPDAEPDTLLIGGEEVEI